jgi:hypothetical protein
LIPTRPQGKIVKREKYASAAQDQKDEREDKDTAARLMSAHFVTKLVSSDNPRSFNFILLVHRSGQEK